MAQFHRQFNDVQRQMRIIKALGGHRANQSCVRRWSSYPKLLEQGDCREESPSSLDSHLCKFTLSIVLLVSFNLM